MPDSPKSTERTEQDTPWYGDGLHFECTQCGNCCTGPQGFVWFSDEESHAMAEYLNLPEREFRARYARRKFGRWTLDEVKRDGKYDCVFLRWDSEGRSLCAVYPVRPTQCRTWPFWDSNMKSPQAWDDSASHCPGMRGGKNFVPVEEIIARLESNPKGL